MEKYLPQSPTANFIEQILILPEQIEVLRVRINELSEAVSSIKATELSGWMTLEQAASELGKSAAAVYQRINHKDKPMPEGVVWKQDGGRGSAVYVDVKAFKEWL